ncbi:hypothetical protein GOODEAATRI_011626 [Goodea atripinnis]|uniref:Rho guanine nucleotide exchange factor 7 n=1 Tax=Goodea atripinnis TaxID=208336 RepID=A0ABV0NKY2_9TELE
MVKARFNFKQNNEDELSFNKGEVILVTRQEEGGWWEGTLNGRTGWFPSNYVVQDILEHEREFVKELQTVLTCYLRPLQASDKLSSGDSATLCGNLEEILTFQQKLCSALEDCTNDELGKFMESQGASGTGILTLTTSLSKPFMRFDKYPTLLQELERHVEDLRKRKNLELQILSEPVRGWEGDSMKSLGQVAYMSQVHVRNGVSEGSTPRPWLENIPSLICHLSSFQEKEERYLMLFPNVLLMLSASPRMSGFIYQVRHIGRLPLTGTTVTRQVEDAENTHAFDITVSCVCLDNLLQNVDGKPLSTVGNPTHLPHPVSPSAVSRGPLEPPKTSKPWTLSCLRPAPPLKPSAALGYKEVGSCRAAETNPLLFLIISHAVLW